MAGRILGDRYQVKRQLGRSSGRWTLLALDLQTNAPVILKLLLLNDDLRRVDLKLFTREAEALKSLNHPSTPQYLGTLELDLPKGGKALALVHSYVPGKSIERFLQEGRVFSEIETIQIAKAVLRILSYLHGHQPPIVHRDIKPGNILLAKVPGRRGVHIRLVDFGSVKPLENNANTAFTMVGTDGYIPPEQLGGRAITASDLFSLGMTMIAMMAGQHPSQLPGYGYRIDFELLLDLTPGFVTWLKRITEPNLERRFSSAEEALDGLQHMLDQRAVGGA